MNIFVLAVGVFLVAGILKNTKFSKATVSGKQGEKLVNDFLRGKSKDGLLISNLILKENEKYTQIDHVFITDRAIFIIETKNHGGYILGDEEGLNWTTMYGKKKFKLYNPLKQNETHVNMLRRALGKYGQVTIVPIVVFSNDKCQFNNNIKGVYKLEQFKSRYKYIINTGNRKIDKATIYNKLKSMDMSKSKFHSNQQIKFAERRKHRV